MKEIFNFGPEEMEAFTYIGIGLKQNSDFSVKMDQNSYIDSIQEIALSKERMKDRKSSLTPSEKTLYRSIVGQLYWVAGISRPGIGFAVCESSTKFIHATVGDIIYVNKIIRKVKNSRCFIQFPKLDLNNMKLQLFTDASFNNLPNGSSQAGQIMFLTDSKNRTCPLYWNSSKLKRVVRSTIAAGTLSLSDGCDVAIYINRSVSQILRVNGSQLDVKT